MISEITKTKNQRPKTKDRIVWFAFALIIVFVYFFGLSMPLVGPDEARYAQVAREMFERGDFVTPTLGGFDWFEKPALLYWLEIVAYKIFGVNEFAARVGSAIFGLGTIFCLWILGKSVSETQISSLKSQIANEQSEKPKTENQKLKTDFAEWLALIAASSIGLLVFSRGASFDIILTFPLTAALVAFFIFDQSKTKSGFDSRFSLLTFYFFIGIALLAKGLIGIVFPAAIVAFYFVLQRKFPSKIFLTSLLWGTILSLLVASVWYLPMYRANGWKFIDEFIIQHHFQRFTSDKYQHHQPFWFFFVVLPLLTLPWLPFFLASIWQIFKPFFQRKTREIDENDSSRLHFFASPLLLFSVAWLVVPLVFFTFSGSKLPGYILPALPAALILTAQSVFDFARKNRRRKIALQISTLVFFVLLIASLQFVAPHFAEKDSTKNLIETANAKGYAAVKIVNLYTVTHNAEFYAAGRLLRDADGKLTRFDDFSKLILELRRKNEPEILALINHASLPAILDDKSAHIEVLDDNGDTAIVLIKIESW